MVKHIMADGRVLESIEGVVIPETAATRRAYELLAAIAKKEREPERKENEKEAAAV